MKGLQANAALSDVEARWARKQLAELCAKQSYIYFILFINSNTSNLETFPILGTEGQSIVGVACRMRSRGISYCETLSHHCGWPLNCGSSRQERFFRAIPHDTAILPRRAIAFEDREDLGAKPRCRSPGSPETPKIILCHTSGADVSSKEPCSRICFDWFPPIVPILSIL